MGACVGVGLVEHLKRVKVHGFDIGVDLAGDPFPVITGMLRGWYEGREVRTAGAVLTASDRVIELGAGLGVVTCRIASCVGAGAVVAYEANPAIAARARDNLGRNGFAVEVREGVLRPQRRALDQATFSVAPAFWGSSLVERADARETIVVPVQPLETVLRDFEATVLIMDIEGGEIEILEEANLQGLRAVIFETHEAMVGMKRTNQAIQVSCSQGFVVDFSMSGDGVVVLRRDE
jgi:FkbM family methyltransferase